MWEGEKEESAWLREAVKITAVLQTQGGWKSHFPSAGLCWQGMKKTKKRLLLSAVPSKALGKAGGCFVGSSVWCGKEISWWLTCVLEEVLLHRSIRSVYQGLVMLLSSRHSQLFFLSNTTWGAASPAIRSLTWAHLPAPCTACPCSVWTVCPARGTGVQLGLLVGSFLLLGGTL